MQIIPYSDCFGINDHVHQVSCTEIINSAVADDADMAYISNGDHRKRCSVLCALSRVRHNNSDPLLDCIMFSLFFDICVIAPNVQPQKYRVVNGI